MSESLGTLPFEPESDAGTAGFEPRLRSSLRHARARLLGLQRPDGHWRGELEGDTILESEYVLLLHYLGRGDEERVRKACNYVRGKQSPDGSWGLFPGAAGDVSVSTKAYFVLKLQGHRPQEPHMEAARRAILEMGGLESCNSFTKLYLSIFGQYDWDAAPAVPPELALLPKWFPFNLYAISSWSRAIVVPLGIFWAHRPKRWVPEELGIAELRASGPPRAETPGHGRVWKWFFQGVDRLIKWIERQGWLPLRARALRHSEEWVLERLPKSDGLGAIFPPILNTIIALDCLGYSHQDPVFLEQLGELEKLEIEEGDTLRMQPCFSAVWASNIVLIRLDNTSSKS